MTHRLPCWLLWTLSAGLALAQPCTFSFTAAEVPQSPTYVSMPTRSVAWAGLVRTIDGGRNWQRASSHCRLLSFRFDGPSDKDETVFVTPQRGWLRAIAATWQTEDGGRNWLRIEGEMTSFAFRNSAGWMGREQTDGTTMYVTNTSGRTWSACSSTIQDWVPIGRGSLLDHSEAFAVLVRTVRGTDQYSVGQSVDGGCTWIPRWIPEPRQRLGEVFFLDRMHGWAIAYGGLLFQTKDGGATWTQSSCPGRSFVCHDLFFLSPNAGFVVVRPPDLKALYTGLMLTKNGSDWNDIGIADLSTLPEKWIYGQFVSLVIGRR
jgi:photosystem II stability/assembly factor-like uncharacterized protein